MTSNPAPIVQHVPHDFQHLLAYGTGPKARSQTADTVEWTRCRRRLALGEARLRLFVVTRAAVRPAAPVTAPDGTRLTAHDQRPTTASSVFGKGRVWRHCFTAPGQAGRCPLDAELRLPARCDADRLRAWAVEGTTDASSRERQPRRARSLGLSLSVPAREPCATEAGADVTPFDQPPADPMAAVPAGPILVVPAEGTGVPMGQPPTPTPPVRLGQGQKRGKKQEAVVTGLSTIAPSPRTPQEVGGALWPAPGGPAPAARPRPEGKARRATLEGQAVAMRQRAQRVAQREGPHLQQRVARTDGAEALPQQWLSHVPAPTLGLDILHATESLWDTANALLGETHPPRVVWVRADLEALLAGETDAVITALEAEGQDPTWTGTQRQAVRRTVGSSPRHRPYMHDDDYLACGWPIGTGVVEGACGHLVKDRMEPSGRRWRKAGAQAVLDLRAVRLNGPWDRSWPFHRPQPHQRLYGTSAPVPERAEGQALA